MIVYLFYVSFVSFFEKGGKALLLGSVFLVRCQTSFLKTTHDLTGLDTAWWFCHHVNSFYIFAVDKDFLRGFPLVLIVLEKQNFCPEMSRKCPEILIWNSCGHHVSAFDSSASWVCVSRCEIKSSHILMIFSTLHHKLVCHIEHFSVELYTLHNNIWHDKGNAI